MKSFLGLFSTKFTKLRDETRVLILALFVFLASLGGIAFNKFYQSSEDIDNGIKVGELSPLQGVVEKKSQKQLHFSRVEKNLSIKRNDAIYTGSGSKAKIDLGDSGIVTLDANTVVVVNFVDNPVLSNDEKNQSRILELTVHSGTIKIDGRKNGATPIRLQSTEGQSVLLVDNESVEISFKQNQKLDSLIAVDSKLEIIDSSAELVIKDQPSQTDMSEEIIAYQTPEKIQEAKARRIASQDDKKESLLNRIPSLSELGIHLERESIHNGPFYYRRPWGVWFQGGGSLVTQEINNPTLSSGVGDTQQIALRNGAGLWFSGFAFEGYWREPIVNTSEDEFQPRWVQGYVSYLFELPQFFKITPLVSLLAGWEDYKNEGSATATYLKGYSSPTFGFRSRFILGEKWETGGDLQMTYMQNAQKLFVQGDIRYWLDKQWSIGGGYWLDTANISTSDGFEFSEKSYALETYVRWIR